jgi:diaminohydroxyphosphoribosylaminopyrimidine deaminase/5-amino-6-(5-phosphoribosylamino)uracil reductase
MVGAILVYGDRIIGEGYHRKYGEAHAEVNCIDSVREEDRHLIPLSTLYVSLEPCSHFGKTPPCADLIVRHQIPVVVAGCRDPFEEVRGKGIEKLQHAGIKVIPNVLKEECMELNKRFFIYHTRKRPYITLKWAQTLDGKLANSDQSRLKITGAATNRTVHRWRGEEMAIMVGTNTALMDDPQLNTRLWPGNDPVRLVLDLHLRLPKKLKIFSTGQATIVFNLQMHTINDDKIEAVRKEGVGYYQVTGDVSIVHQVLNALYRLKINSILIEGGGRLLQSFIEEGAWDEARVITNETMTAGGGLPAPVLEKEIIMGATHSGNDVIRYYKNRELY